MAFETGVLIDVRIAEESSYGVPVAPPSTKTLPVISANFQDDENLIEDRTAYSEDPDLRSEKAGHFQPTFELVLGIPVYAASSLAVDSAFIDLIEFALGKAAVIGGSSGVLPTYTSGDAFFDLSGDTGIVMEMGNVSNDDSFTCYKKTITGHETAYGCIIQNVTLRGGLDDFVIVTITGQCKGVAKFQDGLDVDGNLVTTNNDFTVADQVKGRIGVGSYIKFVESSGFLPATGGRIVTAFNPDTRVGTYSGANLGSARGLRLSYKGRPHSSLIHRLPGGVHIWRRLARVGGWRRKGGRPDLVGGSHSDGCYGLQPLRRVLVADRHLPARPARHAHY